MRGRGNGLLCTVECNPVGSGRTLICTSGLSHHHFPPLLSLPSSLLPSGSSFITSTSQLQFPSPFLLPLYTLSYIVYLSSYFCSLSLSISSLSFSISSLSFFISSSPSFASVSSSLLPLGHLVGSYIPLRNIYIVEIGFHFLQELQS